VSLPVRVICRPETAAGFRLAGLAPRVMDPDPAGLAAARAETRSAGTGVVLMDQALFDGLTAEDRRRLGKRPLPIVVPIPPPAWRSAAETAEAYVLDLLRQVIGYRVRLK